MGGCRLGDGLQGNQLEPVYIRLGLAVGRGHFDKLAPMIEGKGQQLFMPAAACGRPVDLFEPPVLAKGEFLAAGVDHVAELGLRRV